VHRSARALHPSAGKPRTEGPRVHDALAGARMVAGSSYLIAIAGMVGLYELVSTNLDYVFTTMADANFPSRDAMAAYQGRVFFWANLGALVMQIGLVSWIHQRLGVKAGLLVLPLILLVGSALFAAEPMLLVISGVIGADGALSYSVNQSSKEVLYTPTDRDTTYKAKAFIDMFVFRSAKAVGGAFLLFYAFRLTHLGLGMGFLASVNVALASVWIGLVWVADRHYRRLEGLVPAR
jgi:AAA family ATP:ADP antiporter